MISYDEFLEAVKADHYVQNNNNGDYLGIEWVTGGMTGGNCWDGNATRPREADSEPDFDSLNAVLLKFAPNLSYIAFEKLRKEHVDESEYDGNGADYYGNYENYTEKKIYLKSLYDFLVAENVLS